MENQMKVQSINVDAIYPNRNDKNSPWKSIQLRVEREKPATQQSDVLSLFLGSQFNNVEKLVTFHTIHEDQIEAFGIQEGDNLNDKFPQPVKLVVSEITESEYDMLDEDTQKSYRAKRIPENANKNGGNYLIADGGEYVYRSVFVTAAADEVSDKYISHVGNTADTPASEKTASFDEVVGDDLSH